MLDPGLHWMQSAVPQDMTAAANVIIATLHVGGDDDANSCLSMLATLFRATSSFYHPSNTDRWYVDHCVWTVAGPPLVCERVLASYPGIRRLATSECAFGAALGAH